MNKQKKGQKRHRDPTTGRFVSRFSSAKGNNVATYDHLSELPEEILRSILSLLTLREATRTSILSRKWRYLWRRSLNLNFDHKNMTGESFSVCRNNRFKGATLVEPEKENIGRFVRWVNQVLELHDGEKLESCRINYHLGADHGDDLDRWIQFAAEKEVENLDVSLFPFCWLAQNYKLYEFPFWLFAQAERRFALKHLSLDRCTLDLCPNFTFSSLMSLSLQSTRISEENLEKILSNCIWLDCLSISYCYCPFRLKIARVGTDLKLKHLSISYCYNLEEVEIFGAAFLSSFEYGGAILKRFCLESSVQPVRLLYTSRWEDTAGLTRALRVLAKEFPHVETFSFSLGFKWGLIPKQLPITFTKVKNLELIMPPEGFLELTSLLVKASPLLHRLELFLPIRYGGPFSMHKGKLNLYCEEHFRHVHLKEVKIFHFHGASSDVQVAVYLLNIAVALEKMTISRGGRLYLRNNRWIPSYDAPFAPTIAVEEVREMLSGEVPSSTQFIVL